jgi:hypothetical protein
MPIYKTVFTESDIVVTGELAFNFLPNRTTHSHRLKVYFHRSSIGEICITEDRYAKDNFSIKVYGKNSKENNAIECCVWLGVGCYKELREYIDHEDSVHEDKIKHKVNSIMSQIKMNSLKPNKFVDVCLAEYYNDFEEYPPQFKLEG